MRYLLLTLVLLASVANAEIFYRAQGATSVTLGDICVPAADGVEIFALDFNTTNLTINISAQGDGVDNAIFTYTGVNLDDYDGTPPAWGNPPASALELEAQADGCVKLHIRDEVFAVTNATEWSIRFTDSTTDAIMDWHVQVLDLANESDMQTAAAAAITAADLVDNTDLEARSLLAASYATASALATVDSAIGGTLDANLVSISGCTITGDGGATPFDVTCP